MLVITQSEGGWVTLGGFFCFQIKSVSGKKVRLAFDAPKWLRILRSELLEKPVERKPFSIAGMTDKQLIDFTMLEVEIGQLGMSLTLQNAEDIMPKINRVVSQAEQLMSEVGK